MVETTQAKRPCHSSDVSDVPPYVEEPSIGPWEVVSSLPPRGPERSLTNGVWPTSKVSRTCTPLSVRSVFFSPSISGKSKKARTRLTSFRVAVAREIFFSSKATMPSQVSWVLRISFSRERTVSAVFSRTSFCWLRASPISELSSDSSARVDTSISDSLIPAAARASGLGSCLFPPALMFYSSGDILTFVQPCQHFGGAVRL